jgi:hypothetical protein
VESESSDIVIRDKNGDYEVGDPPIPPLDDQEEPGNQEAQEDESMSTAKGDEEVLIPRRRATADSGRSEASSTR